MDLSNQGSKANDNHSCGPRWFAVALTLNTDNPEDCAVFSCASLLSSLQFLGQELSGVEVSTYSRAGEDESRVVINPVSGREGWYRVICHGSGSKIVLTYQELVELNQQLHGKFA